MPEYTYRDFPYSQGTIGCKECILFHDGILKGECECKNCQCFLFKINQPIRSSMESEDK